MPLWSLGPHCHSVLRGWRFVDRQWEADFHARGQRLFLTPVRMYALVALTHSTLSLTDYRRYFEFYPGMVLHSIICCLMILLFIGTFLSQVVQKNIVHMAVGCLCIVALFYCYLTAENSKVWGNFAINHYTPAVKQLPPDDAVRQQVEHFIHQAEGSEATYVILLWSFNHWWALALLGFNYLTCASFFVVLVSMIIALKVAPWVLSETASIMIFYIILCTVVFMGISIVLERLRRTNFLNESLLTRELQASQMADSMLNRTLKNLLTDVAANIEVFLAGSAPVSVLEDSVTSLRRGMMACKERQVYLKLVLGEYVPVSQEVSLKAFGQQLAAGRAIRVESVDLSMHLDSTICNLILENAISNAFRHGHPENPQVKLIIEAVDINPTTLIQGPQLIRFVVENAADPGRPPLTAEDVEQLFHGLAHLVSNKRVPTLSDRVGLMHCVMAAQLGGISLSLAQSGSVVRFSATLNAFLLPHPRVWCTAFDWPCASGVQHFPSGLRFCCIDDSKAALRLLEFQLQRWCAPSTVHLLGQSEDDAQRFVSFALEHADVVIVDDLLEYSKTYLGTDLVGQLSGRGFPGLICIRSANDSVVDHERFRQAGAHCCFGKDMPGFTMMEQLKVAYVQLQGSLLLDCASLSH